MTSAAPVVLRTEKLTRHFGTLVAVNQVDFEVREGELRAVIGPNGAGKSTFFKLISGEVPPTAGRIELAGRDITGLPQHAASQLGIAKSFQITTIFPGLTVFENVRIASQCRRSVLDCWTRAERVPGVLERTREILRRAGGLARRGERR
jgi:branched-chain amino acid transport system ATP-binding protein